MAEHSKGARPQSADEIRESFFEFFREKHHLIVPSAPVVPADDPTLLFTNAGMNPFKAMFLGQEEGVAAEGRTWKRVADTQRCIRVSGKHNDLEEVGIDTYHHTLFEMLGNWSFGEYFKKEAIEWAWELLVERWGLPAGRLYATVFGGDEADGLPADEEAEAIWAERTGIPRDHILRFGKKDNFWEMGETGPCGPCSEIHIDLRTDQERAAEPGATLVNSGDPRVMEIWNLVFIQFERVEGGALRPLPAKHVDTGMGFERLCAVMQGKTSNYDTDVFAPLLREISRMAGTPYGKDEATDIAMRVVADHVRAVSFAVADGASPSNEGRGYVVRRILRRAIRYGWDRLGLREPFVHTLVPVLAKQFAHVFPELHAQSDFVQEIVAAEERSFLRTLGQGIELFNQMSRDVEMITGEDAFKLHDTYGFPIDLTQLMARERGLGVDTAGFEKRMAEQRERARAAGKFGAGQEAVTWTRHAEASAPFEFTGYDQLEAPVRILASATVREKKIERHLLLLDRSPFYAESGGQTADTGVLRREGEVIRVLDVQKGGDGFLHTVDRLPADPSGEWLALVDVPRRMETRKHHTAAHLLHAALRRVLGTHVVQKGSLVTLDKTRFDFAHHQAMTPEELREVERMVNERIQQNIPLFEERDVPIDEARGRGAMMLFGEKYGEKVRMITFDREFSMELCAGTHAQATGEIGCFRIVQETSVAAGIRRVEAVAGLTGEQRVHEEAERLKALQALLGNQKDPVGDLEKLLEERKELESQVKGMRMKLLSGELDRALAAPQALKLATAEGSIECALHASRVEGASAEELKQLGYQAMKRQTGAAALALASADPGTGKVALVAALSEELVAAGLHAGVWIKALASKVGGGGGGQPGFATAGGRDASAVQDMLSAAGALLGEQA